jgi:hypothetical protein
LKIYKKRGKEALDERKKMKDEMNRQSKYMEINQHQLNEILAEEEIQDINKKVDGLKEEVCDAKKVYVECRDALRKHKNSRGCPVESVIAQLEKVLAKYGCTREAYPGGDFNGVSIRALVQWIVEIMPEIRQIIIMEKDPS